MKKLIIVLGAILGVGILLIGIGIIIIVANPEKFGGFTEGDYEEKHLTEEQTVTSLYLDIGSDAIEILPSDDGKLSITYYENNRRYYEYSYKNGKVVFTQKQKTWFSWGIGKINRPIAKIYLPDTVTDTLDIDMASGSIKTDIDKITVKNLKVDVASGSVNIANVEAEEVDIEVSSGSIKISDVIAKDFDIDVASGVLNFDNCTAKNMRIEVSSGTLKIENLTVDNVIASLSSGNMKIGLKGTLDDYRVKGKASSGSISVKKDGETIYSGKDITCGSGDKSISVSISSGSASVNFEE